ncbi:LysR family transcriptional regulator, partial [Variovorax sp. RB2P76]|uniref:LysR family transcriptional regulator n=1 Tax=Variovorax sp. RB2P76 TaxID=3443736 RepID=UPI003F468044
MNLRYLQYLRLVIEHGSFAAAALAGGVSQPAISHGLRVSRQSTTPLRVVPEPIGAGRPTRLRARCSRAAAPRSRRR